MLPRFSEETLPSSSAGLLVKKPQAASATLPDLQRAAARAHVCRAHEMDLLRLVIAHVLGNVVSTIFLGVLVLNYILWEEYVVTYVVKGFRTSPRATSRHVGDCGAKSMYK